MLVLKFLALLAAGATAAAAISLKYEDFEPVNMNREQVRLFLLFFWGPSLVITRDGQNMQKNGPKYAHKYATKKGKICKKICK